MRASDVALGEPYRDKVSGWNGIAMGRIEYMNGCWQIQLGGSDDKDEPKSYWFDDVQIEADTSRAAVRLPSAVPESDASRTGVAAVLVGGPPSEVERETPPERGM